MCSRPWLFHHFAFPLYYLCVMRKRCLFPSLMYVRELRPEAIKNRSQTLTLRQSPDRLRTAEHTLLPARQVGPAFQLTLKPLNARSSAIAWGPSSNQKPGAGCTCLWFPSFHPGWNSAGWEGASLWSLCPGVTGYFYRTHRGDNSDCWFPLSRKLYKTHTRPLELRVWTALAEALSSVPSTHNQGAHNCL